MSIARSSRPLRSMTIGINGMGGSPVMKRSAWMKWTRTWREPGSGDRGLVGLGGRDVADDLVDQAVLPGLHGRHVAVALGVAGDDLVWLVAVLGEDLVDVLLVGHDLLRLDLDVRDLAADLAVRLVDHDLGVREGEPLPLGPAREQDRPAGSGQSDAVGGDRALDELHRIVDGQGAGDAPSRAVDVEADPLGT